MATLPQLVKQLWPQGTIGPVYGQNEGAITEQGVDVLLPAGQVVTLPEAGTLVWNNGYQAIFRLANGLYNSFTHIVAGNIKIGTTYQAGTPIGLVSGQTGWPLHIGNYTYYSSAPHIEYGIYQTLNNAISFVQGINPTAELSQAAQGKGAAVPLPYLPGTSGSTPVLGGLQQWIDSGMNALSGPGSPGSGAVTGSTPVIGGIEGGLGAAGSAIQTAGGIGYGLETVFTWLGSHLFRWVIVIGLALAMLVVLDQLLTHGAGLKTAGKLAVAA